MTKGCFAFAPSGAATAGKYSSSADEYAADFRYIFPMAQMSIPQALELAMQHHREGRFQQAEMIYRQILTAQPNHAEALQQFGVLAFQAGRLDAAEELLRGALAIEPSAPDAHYNLGLVLATAGKLDEAIGEYRQALHLQPNLVEACNNLAAALLSAGKVDEGIETARQAIRLRPDLSEAHNNLGAALRQKGKLAESIDAHRQATVLRAQSADSWNGLGISLQAAGRLDEAQDACQRALTLKPDHVDAMENLAAILRMRGRPDRALPLLRQALSLRPNAAETLCNVGAVLIDVGQFDEAIEKLRRAIELKPTLPDAHNNLGIAFRSKGELALAEKAHRQALALRPNYPEAWRNLGQILQLMARTHEAIDAYRQSLAQRPDYAEALSSLGTALMELRRVDQAIAAFRQAIAAQPDYHLAHSNLAHALLLVGQWNQAWQEHEWRLKSPDFKHLLPPLHQPAWDGSDLGGKRILVHSEQGLGDTIQFARYLPLVAQRGGKVIFLCYASLRRLLEGVEGVEQCIDFDQVLPDFDVQIPLMSLPRVFDTTLETVPANVPYISAHPQLAGQWRKRLPGDKLKVGLVWAGRPDHKNDRHRSMPLSALAPLARFSGLFFCSLQKGEAARQIQTAPPGLNLADWTSELNDFADTAALLEILDLLISVDTAAAHLAGAMAKPVWLLNAFFGDWRYMLDRSDNPWYPTMRVFRQPVAGDWQTPIQRVVESLAELVARQSEPGLFSP